MASFSSHPLPAAQRVKSPIRRGAAKIQNIVESLTQRVQNEEWTQEEVLPSRNQLAVEYDVSPATVSIAVRKLEAEGLLHIVPSRGVFISERAAEKHGKLLHPMVGLRGSYVPSDLTGNSGQYGYGMMLVRCIWEAAHRKNAPLVLMSGQTGNGPLTPRYCHSIGVRGVIFLGGETHQEAMQLRNAGVPIILANQPSEATPLNYVDYDHEGTLRDALKRFTEAGHRRIAVISLPTSVKSFTNKLRSTFIETLCDLGIEEGFTRYWRCIEADEKHDPTDAAIIAEVDALLSLPKLPTAIFVRSSRLLPFVQAALEKKGKKIALIAAGLPSEMPPPVTGYTLCQESISRELLDGIYESIRNPFHFIQKHVPFSFVDKGSIHPPQFD